MVQGIKLFEGEGDFLKKIFFFKGATINIQLRLFLGNIVQ
jgi:hypothetical protein